jgi:hypothetical protein
LPTFNNIFCSCQVVWSVATAPASNEAFYLTAESSLQYSSVIINLGEVWSHDRNAATITVPGIYYTVVTMGISCVQPTVFWLRVNTENVFKVILPLRVHQTQDNGAVIRLDVGDTLNVTMESPVSAQVLLHHFHCHCVFFRHPFITRQLYLSML